MPVAGSIDRVGLGELLPLGLLFRPNLRPVTGLRWAFFLLSLTVKKISIWPNGRMGNPLLLLGLGAKGRLLGKDRRLLNGLLYHRPIKKERPLYWPN